MAFAPKPTGILELASTGAINSSTLRAFLAMNELSGMPRELRTNTVGSHAISFVNSTRYSGYAGGTPYAVPGGFPYATSPDVVLRFSHNGRGYMGASGTGWNTGSLPTTRTMAVTFKCRYLPNNASHAVALLSQGNGNGDVTLSLAPLVTGNQACGGWRLALWSQFSNLYPPTDLIVYPGTWYTAAISEDATGGAGTQSRYWWLYDWAAAQTYIFSQTNITTNWYSGNGNAIGLNLINSNLGGYPGFVGDMYVALLDNQVWTPGNGNFAAHIADPIAPARGAPYSSSSGTLTPSTAAIGHCTATTISINSARPTGGTTFPTGDPYRVQHYRSQTAAFTPGVGTAISGGTTADYVDTPPAGVDQWYYKTVWTDYLGATVTAVNSQSASFPQMHAACDSGSPLVFLHIGDSITDNYKDAVATALYGITGAPVIAINAGVQGGTTQTGSTVSVHPGNYNLGTHGSPTGGTFPLTWNGNTATIAYNATSSAVQTALSAFPGWSGVTCGGGPLPASVVWIALPSSLHASPYDLTVSGNSLAGGSQAAAWCRSQARVGMNILLDLGGSVVTIQLGANDANNLTPSQWAVYETSLINYVIGKNGTAVPHYGVPRSDISETQTANLQGYDAQIDAIVASINDPTKCVAGDKKLFAQACRVYTTQFFGEAGRVHPGTDRLMQVQVQLQAAALAKVFGIQIGAGGTYTSVANVRAGTNRGDGQIGTMAVPARADVRSGTAVDASTGLLVVPPPANVLSGTTYDNGTPGTATVPGPGLVYLNTQYGAGGTANVGTRTDCPINKALAGTSYGAGGSSLQGTVTQPVASDVRAPIQYGASGIEFTGTYAGGGGGGLTAAEIATAVWTTVTASDFTTLGSPGYAIKNGLPISMSQPVPMSNTPQTVGDSLNASRAQGFGKWTLTGLTLTLYAGDGTTPVRTFTLDSETDPTSRS